MTYDFAEAEINVLLSAATLMFSAVFILYMNIVRYKFIFSEVLEPTFMLLIFYFVFFVLNGSLSFHFSIYSLFLTMLGLMSFICGYYRYNAKINFFWGFGSLKPFRAILITAFCCLGVFGVTVLKIYSYGFTIFEYLLNPLAAQGLMKKGGYVWMILTEPLRFSVIACVFCLAKSGGLRNLITAIFILIIFNLATLSTSRWNMIIACLLPLLVFRACKLKRPRFSFTIFIFLLAVPVLMIILNMLRHGSYTLDEFDIITAAFDSIKGDGSPGRHFYEIVDYLNRSGDFHLGWFFISPLISVIPRFLWEGKPITSGLFYYTEAATHYDPILDSRTLTFTYFDFYLGFGIPSLIIGSFIFGWFMRKCFLAVYCHRSRSFSLFSAYMLSNSLNFMRGSIIDAAAIMIVVFVGALIAAYLFKKLLRV